MIGKGVVRYSGKCNPTHHCLVHNRTVCCLPWCYAFMVRTVVKLLHGAKFMWELKTDSSRPGGRKPLMRRILVESMLLVETSLTTQYAGLAISAVTDSGDRGTMVFVHSVLEQDILIPRITNGNVHRRYIAPWPLHVYAQFSLQSW
jgi:hypothetical protein